MHYTADVCEGCESYLIVTLDAEPISDSPFRLRVFCTEFANSVQKLPHATANNPLNEFTHTIRARVSIAFLSTFLSIASDAFSHVQSTVATLLVLLLSGERQRCFLRWAAAS